MVDPELDTIKIYRRVAGEFARGAELSAERGHTVTTPLLPGLSIRLTDIFKPPLQS